MSRPSPALLQSLIRAGSMPVPFTSCWMWIRGYGSHGYGALRVPGAKSMTTAPRVAFEAWHGELGPDECPRHTCDWQPCCNPAHLVRGTQADNMRDMKRRNRNRAVRRLHPAEIVDIRKRAANGVSFSALGRLFGVTYQAIQQIVNRQTWSHIE